jgi:hypothetical protein
MAPRWTNKTGHPHYIVQRFWGCGCNGSRMMKPKPVTDHCTMAGLDLKDQENHTWWKEKWDSGQKWYTRLFKRTLSTKVYTACVVHNPSQRIVTGISSNMQPIAMGRRGSPSTDTPMSGSMKWNFTTKVSLTQKKAWPQRKCVAQTRQAKWRNSVYCFLVSGLYSWLLSWKLFQGISHWTEILMWHISYLEWLCCYISHPDSVCFIRNKKTI